MLFGVHVGAPACYQCQARSNSAIAVVTLDHALEDLHREGPRRVIARQEMNVQLFTLAKHLNISVNFSIMVLIQTFGKNGHVDIRLRQHKHVFARFDIPAFTLPNVK